MAAIETPSPETKTRHRTSRIGTVISNRMEKTAVVAVERRVSHPIYRKFVRRTTKYIVHDERNEAQIGDRVRIVEGRPLSRRKRWRLQEVLERRAGAEEVIAVETGEEPSGGASRGSRTLRTS